MEAFLAVCGVQATLVVALKDLEVDDGSRLLSLLNWFVFFPKPHFGYDIILDYQRA